MKTPYVNMGIGLQKKLSYLIQLFRLGSDQTIDPWNVIVMSYTPSIDGEKKYPELILNIKWSIGIEFGLIDQEGKIDGYTVPKAISDKTGWINGVSFHDGVNNLWKAVSTKTIVIKQWRHQKGNYHFYKWNKEKKKFELFIPR